MRGVSMKIKINNFAKIKHADILIDGITVITGENNTGKSTVGKVLYSVFNSLYNLDVKIEKSREQELVDTCYLPMYFFPVMRQGRTANSVPRGMHRRIAKDIAEELITLDPYTLDKQAYGYIVMKHFRKYDITLDDESLSDYIGNTYREIISLITRNGHTVALEIIQRFFHQIFNSQINCLNLPDEEAEVSLTIKEKDIVIGFKKNECILLDSNYNILHEAFFLDDPFILDDISNDYDFMPSSKGIRGQLKEKLQDVESEDILDRLFDAVDAKEKLKEIYALLNQVTEGDIVIKNGNWDLDTKQFNEPFRFENLSAGLKSFVLIKLLLEKGILKEKDVLILDEPEIHLHPEWQLLYAEIIVLLQKKFDLSLVVTTHSSHFLEAIECYSRKYEIVHKCNYYLATMENGLATFENVTNCLEKIYKQMVTPSMLLDKLKYEMEQNNE